MSVDERVLDVSQRLARELAQAKQQIREDRERLSQELDDERRGLSEELSNRKNRIADERHSLAQERVRMTAVTSEVDDEVFALNVGGTIFSTRRSTLCVFDGSFLANLFSGRWESSIERDAQGRYFLDFDPASFRLVLNFLRSRRIQSQSYPVPPPDVPRDRQEHFRNLVEYLGLTAQLQQAAEEAEAAAKTLKTLKTETTSSIGDERRGILGSASALLSALRGGNSVAPPTSTGAEVARTERSFPLAPRQPIELSRNGSNELSSSSSGVALDTAPGANSQPLTSSEALPPQILKVPGWSRKQCHECAHVDSSDIRIVMIDDTRALAAAAAARGTRGFTSGRHAWTVAVDLCSDWSYIGFVSDRWSSFTSPIGRSSHSWGIASNGAAYVGREEVARLAPFSSGASLRFVLDMDAEDRVVSVVIDGHEFRDVFKGLPCPLYPAASNCRSAAKYALSYIDPNTGIPYGPAAAI